MAHAKTYVEQAAKVLDMERTEIVYNSSWFTELEFLDVIRLASRFNIAPTEPVPR